MASLVGMGSDVTWHAEQADVRSVEAEGFHLLKVVGSLYWHDVVAVNTWCHQPMLAARLAQSLRSLPYLLLSLCPSP